ncbi:MAG: ATP-binding protein [Candidatus Schekmanbacteria bacterium]|nr:ATP-binding protein [Candidatus Schekmanbacteria bacterium]
MGDTWTERDMSIRVELPTVFKNELVAEAVARQVAELSGFSEEEIEEIETALGEACINAIEYSKCFNDYFTVTFTATENFLQISVEDKGEGFSPEEVDHNPTISSKLNSEYKRGWGLMLIEQLMDEIQISQAEPSGTKVEMKKYKSTADQQ